MSDTHNDMIESLEPSENKLSSVLCNAAANATKAATKQKNAKAAVISVGDVDFSADEKAFIVEWGAQLDVYLAGSPYAGDGVAFARDACIILKSRTAASK